MPNVFIRTQLTAPGTAGQLYRRVRPVVAFRVERYFLQTCFIVGIVAEFKAELLEQFYEAIDLRSATGVRPAVAGQVAPPGGGISRRIGNAVVLVSQFAGYLIAFGGKTGKLFVNPHRIAIHIPAAGPTPARRQSSL